MITEAQKKTVEARGKVLVSASAGAGKTTVMISRLANILENGASLDEVLAVTFTKKAAAQMKEKLKKELIARMDTDDADKRERIKIQLGKISTADISTIHSFCARLIRTYFYALKIDASFEVLSDGAEAVALKNRALDEVFDRLYSANDPDFDGLLEKLKRKRSDKTLREMILSACDEVRKYPNFRAVLNSADGLYTQEGFEKVAAALKQTVAGQLQILISAIDAFSRSFKPAVNAAGYLKILSDMRATLSEYASSGGAFSPPARLTSLVKPRVKPENADADESFVKFTDGVKSRYKAIVKDLDEEVEERGKFFDSGVTAKAFISVLNAFIEAYDGVKREEGKLDYADLEHLAYELLKGDGGDSDVREGIKNKYAYVFVDEYQDVNPIQDEIIGAVAERDSFFVGDLKQAIYGFRGSNSRFFADKSGAARARGEYYVLPENFRSGKNVISFVNDIFSRIMIKPLCEFNYGDGHVMRGGARYPAGYDGVAEIVRFDGDSGERERAEQVYTVAGRAARSEEFSAEGLAVLRLVEEALKSTYYDVDEKREKRVQTGDICVLTRKRDNAATRGIVRALSSKYPVAGAAEVNVCDRPEIIRLLNVLAFLDNGRQDVPAAAAMLSPFGGFSEEELIKIRVFSDAHREEDSEKEDRPLFYECCKRYASFADDNLAAKLNDFYDRTEKFKRLARSIGAAKLVDEIMCVGNFASAFDTEQKLTALRRLQREAYTANGELYLGAFLAKIKLGGYNVPAPAVLASDCIKVMTIHASKGLEFPVVIVADVAASFKGDSKSDMPFCEDFGFAPRSYDADKRTYANTLLRKLYKMRGEREELANEINLFYVACTRAKYALHVLTSKEEEYDFVRANFADCYADLFDVSAFTPRILPDERVSAAVNTATGRVLDASRAAPDVLAALREIASFNYGYELGVELPVKSSASRIITMRGDENAAFMFGGETDGDEVFPNGARNVAINGEKVIDEGVAYHRFLELCDFSIKDKNGVEAETARWVGAELITSEQRKIIKTEQILKILAMPAFDTEEGWKTFREREFVCLLSSDDYLAVKDGGAASGGSGDDGNGVIVQGAIDLLKVFYNGGKAEKAQIIDYKYSALPDEKIRKKYASQLALYKRVVCKIYGLDGERVTTTIINIRECRQISL